DSLEVAFAHGGGTVLVEATAPGGGEPQSLFFSERHACPTCGGSYPEIAPELQLCGVKIAARRPVVRGVVPGYRAALLLVQQPAWRLSDVRRSRCATAARRGPALPRADNTGRR